MSAIYYHPEAFSVTGHKLMGRNAAGESFLRGYLKHSKSKEFWAQIEDPIHADDFKKKMKDMKRSEAFHSINNSTLASLSQAEVLFFPGPNISFNISRIIFHSSLSMRVSFI